MPVVIPLSAPGEPTIVVVKLGGSLLDLPDLKRVVQSILDQRPRPDYAPLFVVGGGRAADMVREWDRLHRLGEEASHALALEAMTLNEAFLQRLIPEMGLVRNRQQFESITRAGGIPLLCVGCFLKWAEVKGGATIPPPLPHTWDVTSDSIAAWVAACLAAQELILVKSVDVPGGMSSAAAADGEFVDVYFPELANRIPAIGWMNARAGALVIEPWLPVKALL